LTKPRRSKRRPAGEDADLERQIEVEKLRAELDHYRSALADEHILRHRALRAGSAEEAAKLIGYKGPGRGGRRDAKAAAEFFAEVTGQAPWWKLPFVVSPSVDLFETGHQLGQRGAPGVLVASPVDPNAPPALVRAHRRDRGQRTRELIGEQLERNAQEPPGIPTYRTNLSLEEGRWIAMHEYDFASERAFHEKLEKLHDEAALARRNGSLDASESWLADLKLPSPPKRERKKKTSPTASR
jgi:hypothetical protein